MEFRILGPLEVVEGSRPIRIGGPRQRALLALLLLHVNETVPSDRLLEELWVDPGAKNALEAAVSRLRKGALGRRLETGPGGYLLRVEPGELDVMRFERGLADGRRSLKAGDAEGAAGVLREALSLFRGEPLTDFRYEPFAQAEIARLEELRLEALEARIEADLELGRHAEVVAELETLVGEHPLKERFRAQLMLALYRSGCQAEALEQYHAAREQLLEELGLEPGPELRELERAILQQDAALAPAPRASPRERRKTVTVLALQLAGMTPDPEGERALEARVAALAAPVLERHGGNVHGYGGGQVVAIFGAPHLHEDDALRASRAAMELRELPELAESGVGIASGEVLAAGTEVTGTALVRAAELARAARQGEILITDATARLAPAALECERVDGGRRLLAVEREVRPLALRLDTPFIGRDSELERLRESFSRVAEEGACRLVSVIGDAGIGKTRLARELAASLRGTAWVLTGRCLPYGEGITFWPLRELVQEAGAGGGTRAEIADLLGGAADRDLVAERIAGALGTGEGAGVIAEVHWAARRLLEELARTRPLLVVLEDVQWAEPTFLDLLEHVADLASGPIVLLCLGRPELLDARPAWAEWADALLPLSDDDATSLLLALGGELPPATSRSVLEAAEGNPLFLEQLAAALGEPRAGATEALLPPTLQALLAARLERLGPGESTVLERAAVLGDEFSLPALTALLPAEGRSPAERHLDALAGKGFAERAASGDYRFRHVLIQQAAYRSIPKALRAELHERVADWLEERGCEPAFEHDEIVAYHLEQAHSWLQEIGADEAQTSPLALRAADRLAAANQRALARGDLGARAGMLARACALLPRSNRRRPELELSLGVVLSVQGEAERATEHVDDALNLALELGEPVIEARARLTRVRIRTETDPETHGREAENALRRAEPILAAAGDESGLALAAHVRAKMSWYHCRFGEAEHALERMLEHARAGDGDEQTALGWLTSALLWGPAPVDRGVARCRAIINEARSDRVIELGALATLGPLSAMRGEFEEARDLLRRAREICRDLGMAVNESTVEGRLWIIEMLAGDPRAAESALRPSLDAVERRGHRLYVADKAAALAQALYAQACFDEAEHFVQRGEEAVAADDRMPQILLRSVRAKVLARSGDTGSGEHIARDAVLLAAATDALNTHADALMDLAVVLGHSGRSRAALQAVEGAHELYERKGNIVSSARARASVDRLREALV